MPRKRKSRLWKKAGPYVAAGVIGLGAHAGLKAIEGKPIFVKPRTENAVGALAGADVVRRLVRKKGTGRKVSIGAGAGVGAIHPGMAIVADAVAIKPVRKAMVKGAKATRRALGRGAKWAWKTGREEHAEYRKRQRPQKRP